MNDRVEYSGLRSAWATCVLGAALGGLLPAAPAAAAQATAPPDGSVAVAGFTHVQSFSGIDEYRLDGNGLTVLLVPDHSAPVVTFQVTYQVGSRNEVTGTTGATHILEHMMFKGSENFNDAKGNSVKQFLEHVGGQFNATTSFDRTNYFATIGRANLEGYIAIEADRMRHLWLREEDRQAGAGVRRRPGCDGAEREHDAVRRAERRQARSRHEQHRSDHHHDRDHGAEVGLDEDEQAESADEEADRTR